MDESKPKLPQSWPECVGFVIGVGIGIVTAILIVLLLIGAVRRSWSWALSEALVAQIAE